MVCNNDFDTITDFEQGEFNQFSLLSLVLLFRFSSSSEREPGILTSKRSRKRMPMMMMMMMRWADLPHDILAHIFSYLPPDSLVRAMSACTHWARASPSTFAAAAAPCSHPPWFVAMPARCHRLLCHAHDPSLQRWHSLPLRSFVPRPIRPLASLFAGLMLCKLADASSLLLALCNPFSKQFRLLPNLAKPRANPAVAVIAADSYFRIFVAGGTSGGSYERTLEIYDSRDDGWREAGPMPAEFAVRLTVWTPNESVHADGTIYWLTSARVYSVVGYDVHTRAWREVRPPMVELLEWAALVQRGAEKIGLVGGGCEGGVAQIWELEEGDTWVLVGAVPWEMGMRFAGRRKGGWGSTRCVGSDKALYLFRELGSEMLVWREVRTNNKETNNDKMTTKWEWSWIRGSSSCTSCAGGRDGEEHVPNNISMRAVLLTPTLCPACVLFPSPSSK